MNAILTRTVQPAAVPSGRELSGQLRTNIARYLEDDVACTRADYEAGAAKVCANIRDAVLRVPPCGKAPTIDGECGAKEWEGAATLDRFTVITRDPDEEARPPEHGMTVHATYDADALYLCYVCREEDVGKLILDQAGRDSKPWRNDAVEFGLLPDLATDRVFQFVINAAGCSSTPPAAIPRGTAPPGKPIDTDGCLRFNIVEDVEYILKHQLTVGVPCLYQAEHLVQMRAFLPNRTRKLNPSDYDAIRRTWATYNEGRFRTEC